MSGKTPEKKRKLPPQRLFPQYDVEALYNCRLKVITDKSGQKRCIQRIFTEKPIFPDPALVKTKARRKEPPQIRADADSLRALTSEQLAALAAIEDPLRKYKAAAAEMAAEMASNRDEYLIDHPEEARRPEDIERSARRARARVMDYVLADGDLQYFITLTLNGEYFARDDIPTAFKKLCVWLNNRVQRRGLKYVIVPEFHKDGKAVHFHGFINDALTLTDSGTVLPPDGGRPIKRTTAKRMKYDPLALRTVYNIPEWDYGFTTAIRLYGDRLAAARYAAKYITKEVEHAKGDAKKIGGRWYWSSNNLTVPELIYCWDDFDSAPGALFETPAGMMKVESCNTEFCKPERLQREKQWKICGESQKPDKTD